MNLYRKLAVFVLFLTCLSSSRLLADGSCTSSWVADDHLLIQGDSRDNELLIIQIGEELIVVPLNGTELDGKSMDKSYALKLGVIRVEVQLLSLIHI